MKLLLVTTSRDFFVELEKAGISLTQIKSLTMLAERDEPLSVKSLSDLMGLSLPGISRAIDGLIFSSLASTLAARSLHSIRSHK